MRLPSVTRTVGRYGIEHDSALFHSDQAIRGEIVEVRYTPGWNREVDIYRNGAYVDTAINHAYTEPGEALPPR